MEWVKEKQFVCHGLMLATLGRQSVPGENTAAATGLWHESRKIDASRP